MACICVTDERRRWYYVVSVPQLATLWNLWKEDSGIYSFSLTDVERAFLQLEQWLQPTLLPDGNEDTDDPHSRMVQRSYSWEDPWEEHLRFDDAEHSPTAALYLRQLQQHLLGREPEPFPPSPSRCRLTLYRHFDLL
jgi:hypothetical protein